jgi:uncharacterized membrane protein YesL
MSGMINSFYYGKAGKADFTPENLPSNRLQLFFEMLRVRFSGLFGVNLLFLLFAAPAIVWTVIHVMVLMATLEGTLGENFVTGGYFTYYLLGLVPCFGVAGIGATGEMYILRNWSRDQHSFVLSDFRDTLKANWKQGLLAGLINGASPLIAYVCYTYYGQMTVTNGVFWAVPQTFVLVFCAFWWMMQAIIFPMMVTYHMKFRQLLRNCAILTIARLPWAVLLVLGSFGLPMGLALALMWYVPGIIIFVLLALVLIYGLVGFALTGLVYASYANACFDKFLNPRIEGAPVNLGLRDPEYDDLDDDEEE